MLTRDPVTSPLQVATPSVVRRTTQLLIVVWVLLALGQLVSLLIRFGLDRDNAFGVVPLLDLNEESSLGTWVAAMLLMSCAVLSLVNGLAARDAERRWRPNWFLMAAVFLLLSVDEVGAIHDRLTPYLRAAFGGTSGVFFFAWVIPALALGLAFLLVQLRFLRHLGGFGMGLVLAGVVYVTGAAGLEMAQGVLRDNDGPGSPYDIFPTLEELLEFAGVMLAARVLLRHLLAAVPRTLTVSFTR